MGGGRGGRGRGRVGWNDRGGGGVRGNRNDGNFNL